jgi:hypothetical protein
MTATYRLQTENLNTDLIAAIKSIFHGKEIQIIVSEVTKPNKEILISRLNNINNNKNIVSFTHDEFEKLVEESLTEN